MSLELRQLHPLFAAEAMGVDLSGRVDQAMVDAIWRAVDEYAVVVFRDQRLSDTQLRDFAALFGPLEIGRAAATAKGGGCSIPKSATFPISMKTASCANL